LEKTLKSTRVSSFPADSALDSAGAEAPMTVTLTGATGFVGRQILGNLLERGCSVRVLVRDPSRLHDVPARGALEVVQTPDLFAEVSDRLEELLEGSETLVHAAWHAEPGEYATSPLNLACLTGTLNLASAFAAVGGKRFVGVGTCAEYDPSAGLMTTDTPLAPNTLYAACKASAFQVLRSFLGTKDMSFAWCRIFYLYGEGEDERRLVPYIRRQLGAGQDVLLSHGDQVRDFLDVKDAARMIADVALGQQQGAVNICSGEAVTVRQLAERIADEYGRRELLRFGARPENIFDPPRVVGVREDVR
jgi:nucleoside-diphosphate-sugar epimerase